MSDLSDHFFFFTAAPTAGQSDSDNMHRESSWDVQRANADLPRSGNVRQKRDREDGDGPVAYIHPNVICPEKETHPEDGGVAVRLPTDEYEAALWPLLTGIALTRQLACLPFDYQRRDNYVLAINGLTRDVRRLSQLDAKLQELCVGLERVRRVTSDATRVRDEPTPTEDICQLLAEFTPSTPRESPSVGVRAEHDGGHTHKRRRRGVPSAPTEDGDWAIAALGVRAMVAELDVFAAFRALERVRLFAAAEADLLGDVQSDASASVLQLELCSLRRNTMDVQEQTGKVISALCVAASVDQGREVP